MMLHLSKCSYFCMRGMGNNFWVKFSNQIQVWVASTAILRIVICDANPAIWDTDTCINQFCTIQYCTVKGLPCRPLLWVFVINCPNPQLLLWTHSPTTFSVGEWKKHRAHIHINLFLYFKYILLSYITILYYSIIALYCC